MLLEIDIADKVSFAMKLYCDDMKCEVISKIGILNFLKILNNTLAFFGDKKLQVSQIEDLVDSIYTLRGKVDGDISHDDFITLMFQHPIVELALSIQFQGNAQWKNSN